MDVVRDHVLHRPEQARGGVKSQISKILSNTINNLQRPYAPETWFSHSLAPREARY
jgi:hypothetical protein